MEELPPVEEGGIGNDGVDEMSREDDGFVIDMDAPRQEYVPSEEVFELFQPGFSEAYRAYAEVLQGYEARIRAYWQSGNRSGYDWPADEPRAVALADVNQDGVPELIFLYRDTSVEYASLSMYTYANGQAKKLIDRQWESGDTVSVLYQHLDTGDLCGITVGATDRYHHWYIQDGAVSEEVLYSTEGENGTEYKATASYPDGTTKQKDMEQADYEAILEKFRANRGVLLGYSVLRDAEGYVLRDGRKDSSLAGLPISAMTCDEALAFLAEASMAP